MELSRISGLLKANNVQKPGLTGTASIQALKPPDALTHPDMLRSSVKLGKLLTPTVSFYADTNLDAKLQKSVASAYKEWNSGVAETHGRNRSPRIDKYARNSFFRPGGEWCGFFVAFNYTQAGFKEAPHLASYPKARDFFMYRSYTDNSNKMNKELDNLLAQHKASGSERKYFILHGSPTVKRVSKDYPDRYAHYNLVQNTFNYRNLPVKAGDTALFTRGHIGMVVSYNQNTGHLVTIEGNTSGKAANGKTRHEAVVMKEYNLSTPKDQKLFDGFGRPSVLDFV